MGDLKKIEFLACFDFLMIFGSAPPLTGRGITVGSHRGAPAGTPTWIHDVDGVDSVDPGVMDGAWANVRPGRIYIYIILLGMYSVGMYTTIFFCFVPGKNRVYRDMRRYFVGIFTNGMIMERDVT